MGRPPPGAAVPGAGKPHKRLFFGGVWGFIPPGNAALEGIMLSRPIILKLMCVALVASVVFPMGRMIYPYVAHDIGDVPFGAIQAVFSATLGFGIYTVFFV